jgi:23S rRNA (uracil1939-C5)-methyltransferase
VTLRFQPTDFVQVNAEVNAELVATASARGRAAVGQRAVYCGLGNFSLPFAQRA